MIDNPDASPTLEPALAFFMPAGKDNPTAQTALHIVDGTVSGDFPARFSLDVFVPPPAVLLDAVRANQVDWGYADAPGVIGAITAVPPDHPAVIEATTNEWTAECLFASGCVVHETICSNVDERCLERSRNCAVPPEWEAVEPDYPSPADLDECTVVQESGDAALAEEDNGGFTSMSCGFDGCTKTEEFCGQDGQCYTRVSDCVVPMPPYQLPLPMDASVDDFTECEVIEETGDAELARPMWNQFAGLSEDYRILYMLEDAEPNGIWSQMIDTGGDALKSGYHLLRVNRLSEAELAERDVCYDQAWPRAVEKYNAAEGTAYDPDVDGPVDFFEEPLWDLFVEEQLSCTPVGYPLTLLKDPEQQFIEVHIVPEVADPFLLPAL